LWPRMISSLSVSTVISVLRLVMPIKCFPVSFSVNMSAAAQSLEFRVCNAGRFPVTTANEPCDDTVLTTVMDHTRTQAGGYLENSEVLLRVFLESSESHDQPPRQAFLRLWSLSHRRH
jgi:hypothetical protein